METSEAHDVASWFSGSIPEFVQTGRALDTSVKNGNLLQVHNTRGGQKFADSAKPQAVGAKPQAAYFDPDPA
jgi:hypothetical protein